MLKFLSRKEVAERLGVKTDSINGYDLPEPDAAIGTHRGWRAETIDAWRVTRPGRGNWGKSAKSAKQD